MLSSLNIFVKKTLMREKNSPNNGLPMGSTWHPASNFCNDICDSPEVLDLLKCPHTYLFHLPCMRLNNELFQCIKRIVSTGLSHGPCVSAADTLSNFDSMNLEFLGFSSMRFEKSGEVLSFIPNTFVLYEKCEVYMSYNSSCMHQSNILPKLIQIYKPI